jgi:SAM-dependent methyltransferase
MSEAPTKSPPRLFDRPLLRTRLDRAARRGDFASFLRDRVSEDVVDRLQGILRSFPHAVELGCRDGAFGRALAEVSGAGGIERLTPCDLSPGFAALIPGARVMDEEQLDLEPEAQDLMVSILGLHWTNDLVGALVQIRRSLRPDGLFIGALFTGSTLTELRQSLLRAEDEITGGARPRVAPFADGPDLAGLAQRAGLALPVVDIDRICVRYAHPLKLMADLRAMGETSILVDHARSPLRRDVLARAMDIYLSEFADPDGRIRATFEISTLTGWAPHPDQQKPLRPGSAKTRLADALGVSERKV